MMKNIILCFCILFSCFAFSQENVKGTTELNDLNITKQADFPGGINTFRKVFLEKFRLKKVIADKGLISCELVFVVEKDGSISNIKASGENESFNKETERTVSKIKRKWIPGEHNGQVVRSRFKVPLKVSFD
jgi:protein TonB